MNQILDPIAATYLELHPQDAARTLSRLDDPQFASFCTAIPTALAANVLKFIPPSAAQRCLSSIPEETSAEIIDRMPTGAAAERLQGMDRDKLKTVLALLPRTSAIRLRIRLRYPVGTVGSVVDADVLTFNHDIKVAEALQTARTTQDRLTYHLCVLDEKRRLKGMVDICDLLATKDSVPITQVMQPAPDVLNARMSLTAVQNHRAWIEHNNLPAVDRENVFQGIVPREAVYKKSKDSGTDIREQEDISETQLALADIFWMAATVFFVGGSQTSRKSGD